MLAGLDHRFGHIGSAQVAARSRLGTPELRIRLWDPRGLDETLTKARWPGGQRVGLNAGIPGL